MTRQRRLTVSFAFALAVLPSVASAVDLSDYAGEWRGTGRFERTVAGEKREGRLTCKLVIEAKGADVIVINGRCAVPEGSRGFATRVTDRGGGRLTGEELKGTGARHGRTSSGTLGGSGLHLEGRDALGSFMFALSAPGGGKTNMRSSSSENANSEAARVSLRRSK